MMMTKTIQVVAAVILREGKVLCVQRAEHEGVCFFEVGFLEKVEVGESREEALVRGIEEELVVEIHQLQYLTTVEHSYRISI